MMNQKSCYNCIELEQHIYALLHALVKVYDNYKTPLGSHIICWKVKYPNIEQMTVGMTVQKMDTTVEYITYHLPLEKWNQFDIMTLNNSPVDVFTSNSDVVGRLMRL